ncbi:hypothetical protein PMAYCL1PPCAC_19874, partial [Pristionchus mayeri]
KNALTRVSEILYGTRIRKIEFAADLISSAAVNFIMHTARNCSVDSVLLSILKFERSVDAEKLLLDLSSVIRA